MMYHVPSPTKDSEVCFSIAVIISRDGRVKASAELLPAKTVRALQDVPVAVPTGERLQSQSCCRRRISERGLVRRHAPGLRDERAV